MYDDGNGPNAPEAWRPSDNGYPRPAMPQLWQDTGDQA